MKAVLTLLCLTVVIHNVAAACSLLKTYDTSFEPQCVTAEVHLKWPNYENLESYYYCDKLNSSVLIDCPKNQYYAHIFQDCVICENYLPAVNCEDLLPQDVNRNCHSIGDITTTTAEPTTKSTKSTTSKTTAGPTPPTPPSDSTTSTTGNLPPVPTAKPTGDPNVPTPPVPPPTPPTVPSGPPYEPNSKK